MRKSTLACIVALCLTATTAVAADAGMRDPMKPFSRVAEAPRSGVTMIVNAIFVSDRRRLAIINGQRVRVGESVGGARVTDIQSDHVTFSRSGKNYTLHLGERSGF